jgi:hypothetical protein
MPSTPCGSERPLDLLFILFCKVYIVCRLPASPAWHLQQLVPPLSSQLEAQSHTWQLVRQTCAGTSRFSKECEGPECEVTDSWFQCFPRCDAWSSGKRGVCRLTSDVCLCRRTSKNSMLDVTELSSPGVVELFKLRRRDDAQRITTAGVL